MTDNELLTLADREAQRLTDENDHSAAIIIRELCERLRVPSVVIGTLSERADDKRYVEWKR